MMRSRLGCPKEGADQGDQDDRNGIAPARPKARM